MLLVFLTACPLVAGLVVFLTPRDRVLFIRWEALIGTLGTLMGSLVLWFSYRAGYGGYLSGSLFEAHWGWFPAPLGASFHMGTDGISLVFAVLTALLSTLAITFSWDRVTEREKEYYGCLLLLSAAMLGLFFSMDLLLFYLFWEAMLLPMYFLVGIWGHERRIYASMKFVLYTLLGSLLMLVAIVVLSHYQIQQFPSASMEISTLYQVQIPAEVAPFLFLAFCLAFAIKTPLFPFHTWLPHAHVEAPAAGSVILAGILLKVGVYGFIRLLIPLFPQQALAWGTWLAYIGAIGVLYGGLVAWAQSDIKKLVAYSSISHLGFVILGLFALNPSSMTGGVVQGAIHGINSGALFLLVGMLYSRIHTREMDEIGGLADHLPRYATVLLIMALASVGLPATNGFIGEFIILSSSFGTYMWPTILAAAGVIVSALYMFYLLRKCVFGPATELIRETEDLNTLELITLAPLVVLVFWIGLYPRPVLQRVEPSVEVLLDQVPVLSRDAPPRARLPGRDLQ